MASTDIVPFAEAKLPSFLKGYEGPLNTEGRTLIPQLSIKGKVWRTVIAGKETKLTRVDNEGETVPVQVIRLIVLQFHKARSRSYFEGDYDPKKPAPPTCWSTDGERPDATVKNKQSTLCAKCPQSKKGSKITEAGHETTACAPHKKLVVIPSNVPSDPEAAKVLPPMLLKLPQTSLWDKEAQVQNAKGWYAWDQFVDMLRQKGVPHTGMCEIKAKFDPDPAYPKVLFNAARFLDDEEWAYVKPLTSDPEVAKLLVAPEDEVAMNRKDELPDDLSDDDDSVPPPAAKPKAKAAPVEPEEEDEAPPPKKVKHEVIEEEDLPPPKKKAAPVDEDEDAPAPKPKAKAKVLPPEDDEDDVPPPKAKKKAVVPDEEDDVPPPKAKAKAKVVAPVEDDEDEAPPPKAKKKAAPVDDEEETPPAKPAGKKDSNLKTLLDGWPDEA